MVPGFPPRFTAFRDLHSILTAAPRLSHPTARSLVALWLQRSRGYDAAWCFPSRRAAKGIAELSWGSIFRGLRGNASFATIPARAIAADGGAEAGRQPRSAIAPWQQGCNSRDGRGVERKPLQRRLRIPTCAVRLRRERHLLPRTRLSGASGFQLSARRRKRVTTRSYPTVEGPERRLASPGLYFLPRHFFRLWLEALTSVSTRFSAPSTPSTLLSPPLRTTIQSVCRRVCGLKRVAEFVAAHPEALESGLTVPYACC